MSSYLLLLLFFDLGNFADAEIKLDGSNAVKEIIDNIYLNCTFQESNRGISVYQVSIQKGAEVLVRLQDERNIKILKQDLEIEANGVIDNVKGKAFLNIKIRKPSRKQTGKYTCITLGYGQDGSSKKFTSFDFPVDVRALTELERNVFFINRLQYFEKLYEKVEKLKQIKLREQRLATVNTELETFAAVNHERLSALGNRTIESGTISCNTAEPGSGISWRSADKPVNFKKKFSKPPRIFMGLKSLALENGVRLFAEYRQVTNEGFIVVCGSWATSYVMFGHFEWMAFE